MKRDPLHESILNAIERYRLLDDAESVLVGLSGGQDSVALLHSLVTIQGVNLRIGALHVHHGMRGAEADQDAAVVADLCERLALPCTTVHRDVPAEVEKGGLNPEQAGRAARYQEYERIASAQRFDRIATGHTGTDRAETLLLNLFRGAGLDGLASIPPRRDNIIRPLILAERAETAAYCSRHGLPIRTDRSNLDPCYARRNFIRLQLMPMIEERMPGAEQALMRACQAIEEELGWTEPLLRDRLCDVTIEAGDNHAALDATALAGEAGGALNRLLRIALEETRGDLEGVAREHIELIAELVRQRRSGGVVELPGTLRARREYDRLIIEPDESREPLPDESARLSVPGEAHLPRRAVSVRADYAEAPRSFAARDPLTEYVNADAGEVELVLRSPRPGERFVPLGMTGSKKLQDYLVDNKVPRRKRRRVAVVANPDDQILWVVGHRLAEAARAQAGCNAVRLRAQFDVDGRNEEDAGCDAILS